MVWSSLKASKNQDYVLYTGRLNQDCLENLFGNFRQSQGDCLNPTPIQFIWAFKIMLYLNYFQYSPGANCLDDFDNVLCTVEPSSDKALILEEPNKELFMFKGITVGTVDYRHLDAPEINTFTYVCGYLMKKCLENIPVMIVLSMLGIKKNWINPFYFHLLKHILLMTILLLEIL